MQLPILRLALVDQISHNAWREQLSISSLCLKMVRLLQDSTLKVKSCKIISSLLIFTFTYLALDPMLIGDIFVNPGFELKILGNQIIGISDFKIDKLRLNVEKFKVGSLPPVLILQNKILKWFICFEAGDAFNTPKTNSQVKICSELESRTAQSAG